MSLSKSLVGLSDDFGYDKGTKLKMFGKSYLIPISFSDYKTCKYWEKKKWFAKIYHYLTHKYIEKRKKINHQAYQSSTPTAKVLAKSCSPQLYFI